MDAGVASHGTVSAVNSRAATPAGYGFLSAAIRHACLAGMRQYVSKAMARKFGDVDTQTEQGTETFTRLVT